MPSLGSRSMIRIGGGFNLSAPHWQPMHLQKYGVWLQPASATLPEFTDKSTGLLSIL